MNFNLLNSLLLPAVLFAPAIQAEDLTPWDSMPASVNGSIAVKTKSGQTFTSYAATFSESAIVLGDGPLVPRDEVSEVTVRAAKSTFRKLLWLPAFGVTYGAQAVAGGAVIEGIVMIAIAAPAAAVTLPPALAIEGVRLVKPLKLLYKVRP